MRLKPVLNPLILASLVIALLTHLGVRYIQANNQDSLSVHHAVSPLATKPVIQ